MTLQRLKSFLEKVTADTSLQVKLKAGANSHAVLVITKEAGLIISARNLKHAQSEISEQDQAMREISDGELENAAVHVLTGGLME